MLKLIDWLNKWIAPVFTGFAAIFGILWQRNFSNYILTTYPERTGLHGILEEYLPLLFVVCFIISGVMSFLKLFTHKTIIRLEKDLCSEKEKVTIIANNIETLVNGILLRLSEKLDFNKGEQSRITIYIHNNNGGFISFGRYSPDPTYSGKGRDLLPDSKGCISSAWSCDWCYEGYLTFKQAVKKYKITREEYEKQRMKSVFFAIKRVDFPSCKTPLAVLVVESIDRDRFEEEKIKEFLDNEELYLADIINSLKDHIHDPSDAKRRGF